VSRRRQEFVFQNEANLKKYINIMKKLSTSFFLMIILSLNSYSQDTNKLIELTFQLRGTITATSMKGKPKKPAVGTYLITAHNLSYGETENMLNLKVNEIFVKAYPNNMDFIFQLLLFVEWEGEQQVATYTAFDDFAMLYIGGVIFYLEPLEVSIKNLFEQLPDSERINQTFL
jgi:hypothetical protein